MKKKKLLCIIGAAVLLVAVAVALVCIFTGKEKKVGPEEENLYGGMGEIVYVKYQYSEEENELVKKGDNWRWKDDKTLEVDQEVVANIVESFQSLPVIDFVEDVENIGEYGLKKPNYSAVLKDSSGKTKTIIIGDCASDDGTIWYAMEKGDNIVYMVSYDVIDFLDNLYLQRLQAVEYQELYGMDDDE